MSEIRLSAIRIVAGLGLLWVISTAQLVHAQSAGDPYKTAIETAVLEFEHGNWPEARVLFEQAHALRPSARTLRGMGMVSFELKQYVRAEQELQAALVDMRAPLSEAQRHEVLGLLLRLEQFIGKLKVNVAPEAAHARILLDGSPIAAELKLEVGPHELSVQAPGYRSIARTVSIEGGKNMRLELTLTALDLSARSPQPSAAGTDSAVVVAADKPAPLLERWWFWAAVGAVVVGGTVAAVALSAKTSSEPPLPGNTGVSVQVLTWPR